MNIHRQIHLLPRLKFTELNEIYWAMGLKTMAISLVGIFIPIYLYSLGYSFFWIFLFYSVTYFTKGALDKTFAKLILLIGPKHGLAYSFPLMLAYLWMVMTLPEYDWNLILLGIFSGVSMSLSWMSYHIDFSLARKKKNNSRAISGIHALMTFSGGIAPFVGGIIATRFGISNAFLVSIFLLVLAALPLLKTREPHIPKKLNMKKINLSKIKKDLLAHAGMGFNFGILYEVWPFFLFFILGSYEKVGFFESFALVLTIIITLYVGRKLKNHNQHQFLNKGARVNSILWILKTLTSSVYHIFVFQLLHAFLFPLLRISYFSEVYTHTDEEPRIEYILFMERAIDYARAFLFFFLAVLSVFWGSKETLLIGLILAALGAFLSSSIRLNKDESSKN